MKDTSAFFRAWALASALVVTVGCGSSSPSKSKDAAPDTPVDHGTGAAGAGAAGAGAAGGAGAGGAAGGGGSVDAGSDIAATDAADGTSADASDAASEAAVDAVPTPAPDFIWYVLDETSGTTAKDSSSHHYDMTNLTGVAWDHGAVFNGTNVCGSTTVGPSYRSPPITLSAWLTPATRTNGNDVRYTLQPFPPNAISDDVPGVGGYAIGLNVWSDTPAGSALSAEMLDDCVAGAGLCVARASQNDAAADAGADAGTHTCTSASSCDQGFVGGVEVLVTLTVGPAPASGEPTALIYVNGKLFDSTHTAVPPANASPPLYLGCHNMDTLYGATRFFSGRMRDVRVYQRELGAGEIAQLYANGPTTKAPATDGGAAD
jgi:hypothetical protein